MKLTERIRNVVGTFPKKFSSKHWGKRTAAIAVACAVAVSSFPVFSEASSAVQFKDTSANYWATDAIQWAVENSIVSGYSDGTFKPSKKVSQAEFLTMLVRAYGVNPKAQANEEKAAWDEGVWQFAQQMNWVLGDRYEAVSRGSVAVIMGNALGYACSEDENIQLLYNNGLSNGKTAKTIEGYAKNEGLTRAEAVVFIRNAKNVLDELQARPTAAAPKCPTIPKQPEPAKNAVESIKEISPLTPQTEGSYKLSTSVTNQSKVMLNGSFAAERDILVRVTKGNIQEKEVYTTKGKKIDVPLFLRHGAGEYTIEIFERDVKATGSYKSVIWGKKAFLVTNKDTRDMKYLLPTKFVESDHARIIELAEKITKGLKTDAEKTKAIHDWVAKNVSYDVKSYLQGDLSNHSAIETLDRMNAICSGYVHLTAALNRSLGIKTKIINGTAIWAEDGETWANTTKQDNHAWVEVFVGGKWITQDPTWNAGYVDFNKNKFQFKFSEKYYNPTAKEFAKTHRKTEESPY